MSNAIDEKLQALGLVLPPPATPPPRLSLPFGWARQYGNQLYLSGHGPVSLEGAPMGPFGKVGAEVSLEEAKQASVQATLSLLACVKRTIGDLAQVDAWLMVNGMVNVAPGFTNTTEVINPCSDLLRELFGAQIGNHARTAIGVAMLPLNMPVVISAQIALKS